MIEYNQMSILDDTKKTTSPKLNPKVLKYINDKLENKTYDKIEINRKNDLHNKGAASNSAPHEIIPSTIGTMAEGLSIYIFPFSYPHTSHW